MINRRLKLVKAPKKLTLLLNLLSLRWLRASYRQLELSSIVFVAMVVNLGIAGALLCILAITNVPWLGLKLEWPDPQSDIFEISHITANGPADGILKVGQYLTSIKSSSEPFYTEPFSFSSTNAILEPDTLNFEGYDKFFDSQSDLYERLNNESIVFTTHDSSVVIHPKKKRPLRDLPVNFWINISFALACLIIGAIFFVSQKNKPINSLIFIGSAGFYLNSVTHGVYVNRELSLPPNIFEALCDINHAGLVIFAYSMLIVFFIFPERLTTRPIVSLTIAWCCIILANEYVFQLIRWPLHDHYFPYILAILIAIVAMYFQWQKARHNPVDRAVVLWFLCSFFVTSSVATIFLLVPPIYNEKPIISHTHGQLLVFLAYMGIVLGAIKYRLFEIEDWWKRSWYWLIGASLVILLDMFFVASLKYSQSISLSLSLLIVSLVWLPLRQLIQTRILQPEQHLHRVFSALIHSAYKFEDSPSEGWKHLINSTFKPAKIELKGEEKEPIHISRDGLILKIPNGKHIPSVKLTGKNNNRRLFNKKDIFLVTQLKETFENIYTLKAEKENAQSEERDRIMRDLHDDVCPRLLDLSRKIKEPELTQTALGAYHLLRDTIYLLNDDTAWDLQDLALSWKNDTAQRLKDNSITLHCKFEFWSNTVMLNAREKINIERVLRETTTNTIKHAKATKVFLRISHEDNKLSFSYKDNGSITFCPTKFHGNGVINMRQRLQTLGSQLYLLKSTSNAGQSSLEIKFNVNLGKEKYV